MTHIYTPEIENEMDVICSFTHTVWNHLFKILTLKIGQCSLQLQKPKNDICSQPLLMLKNQQFEAEVVLKCLSLVLVFIQPLTTVGALKKCMYLMLSVMCALFPSLALFHCFLSYIFHTPHSLSTLILIITGWPPHLPCLNIQKFYPPVSSVLPSSLPQLVMIHLVLSLNGREKLNY